MRVDRCANGYSGAEKRGSQSERSKKSTPSTHADDDGDSFSTTHASSGVSTRKRQQHQTTADDAAAMPRSAFTKKRRSSVDGVIGVAGDDGDDVSVPGKTRVSTRSSRTADTGHHADTSTSTVPNNSHHTHASTVDDVDTNVPFLSKAAATTATASSTASARKGVSLFAPSRSRAPNSDLSAEDAVGRRLRSTYPHQQQSQQQQHTLPTVQARASNGDAGAHRGASATNAESGPLAASVVVVSKAVSQRRDYSFDMSEIDESNRVHLSKGAVADVWKVHVCARRLRYNSRTHTPTHTQVRWKGASVVLKHWRGDAHDDRFKNEVDIMR
jgi:hypothetical protein